MTTAVICVPSWPPIAYSSPPGPKPPSAGAATIAVPMAQVGVQRAKERELRIALVQIREAIDAYKRAAEQGRLLLKVEDTGYPHRLEELVEGVTDQRSPVGQKMYFLRRIPRDPFFPDGEVGAARTWRLRSYDSPPDAPQEGRDVFDVYSSSNDVGLNGVPYRLW